MSNFGALLSRLTGLGVPPDAAAQVLHEAVTIGVNTVQYRNPDIEKLEARRERDRERKAFDRLASKEIRGNPRKSKDSPTPPNITNPQSPTGITPKGKHPLPPDFAIGCREYDYAAKLSPPLSRAEADECVEAMKNWAWGKGARKADWVRTLFTFMRGESEKKRSKPANFNRGSSSNGKTSDAVNFGLELAAQLREEERGMPGFGGDGEGEPPPRLLSGSGFG